MSTPKTTLSPLEPARYGNAGASTAGTPFASHLLAAEAELVDLQAGQVLFEQGDPGDRAYVLLRGRLGVRRETSEGGQTLLAELEPEAIVGEMALLTGQARTATVYALVDSALAGFSKAIFERAAEANPQDFAAFARAVTFRLQETQLASALGDLLGEADPAVLRDLQGELAWQHLSHGKVLFRQGDPGESLYVVVSGRLRVVVSEPGGSERQVGEVAPGEAVGELGLLTGEPRAATVYAIRETNVVRLTQPAFARLVSRYPQAMMRIARLVVRRQQGMLRTHSTQPARALTLALVPASPGVPLGDFAHRLAQSLSEFGSVLELDSARLDQIFSREGASQTALDAPTGLVLASWMGQQETAHHYILYVADLNWSAWTQRCVCQADRLILVGEADADPAPGAVEASIAATAIPARVELALLHSPTTAAPTGTGRWLAARHVHAHHHVRRGELDDYQRLARRLTGRAVGLVLSGGGARGIAHVGAFRALEELGIRVDRIGGTSMGAVMGALYATYWNYGELLDVVQRYFAKRRTLSDPTLPLVSLMATKKVTKALQEALGEWCIEDLWCPFFCVSTNLSRAEPFVHETGLLWRAVRASMAIPGVYAPILHGDDVLVDGGPMNDFPADIMHGLCEGGTVIGVNVSPPEEQAHGYEFGDSISGWRVLWTRLNPFAEPVRVPSLVAGLMRTREIRSVYQSKSSRDLADLLIQVDVRQFGVLDFASFEPIIEAGYRAAREQLAEWLLRQERTGPRGP